MCRLFKLLCSSLVLSWAFLFQDAAVVEAGGSTTTTTLSVSKSQLTEMYRAGELSRWSYPLARKTDEEIQKWKTDHDMSTLDVFVDGEDLSLVAKFNKINNVCYGVFRGTIMNFKSSKRAWDTLKDFRQAVGRETKTVNGCKVEEGWSKAYFNDYQSRFESSLKQCLSDCGKSCKLVLTGHSQGAAVADIAAVVWKDYNPTVYGFGGAASVYSPCNAINPHNHYRFININYGDSATQYDAVTQMKESKAKHWGHPLLLAEKDNKGDTASYIGLNDDRNRIVYTVDNHYMDVYLERLKRLVDNNPSTIGQWKNGARCGYNDECDSRRCEGYTAPYHCRPKVEAGESCNENSDCQSDKCVTRGKLFQQYCALSNGKMPNDAPCNYDSHCDSKRCATFKCKRKGKKKAWCSKGYHCESGKCRLARCK